MAGRGDTATSKESDRIHALYRPYIEASPSPGHILQTLSGSIDGQAYDAALQERQRQTLY